MFKVPILPGFLLIFFSLSRIWFMLNILVKVVYILRHFFERFVVVK